jgi:hypothetical protein
MPRLMNSLPSPFGLLSPLTTLRRSACYGIGVSRIVAAAIEQNNDHQGIIWPEALAPFQIALIPLKIEKSEGVHGFAVLGAQLEDMANFNASPDEQLAVTVWAVVTFDDIAKIGFTGVVTVTFPVDAEVVFAINVGTCTTDRCSVRSLRS